MSQMNELAARLKSLKAGKEQLAEATKANNAAIEEVEQELYDLMSAEENDSFEYQGYKYSRSLRPCYSVSAESRETFISALKMFGYDREDIVTETIPAPKLNTVMKGVVEENGGTLPEGLDGIVSLYEKKTIGIRKGRRA